MNTDSDEDSPAALTVDGVKQYMRTPQAQRICQARPSSAARQSQAPKAAPVSVTCKPSAQ